MPVLSIRFKQPEAYDRLKRQAASGSESVSALGERLIDEGLRMESHPGIVFRNGPSGRRAALATGPDVWEVVALLRGLRGRLEGRVVKAAHQLGLTTAQVWAASRYYAAFPHEIDKEVAANDQAADYELRAWEEQRRLLAE